MYQGESTGNQQDYTPFTGLDSFTVLAFNPTTDKIKELTGRDPLNPPDYNVQQDLNGDNVRPLVIYLKGKDSGVIQQLRLNIGNKPAITQGGNYQVITSTGSVVWAKASGSTDVKPEFADHRPLVSGESDLITFVQKCVSFSTKSEEDFMTQMQDLKQDAASIYAGNYTGLNSLADYMQSKGKVISAPLTVKEDIVDGDIKNRQRIAYKRNNIGKTLFSGPVTDWVKSQVLKNTQADPELIKNFYTIELMRYNKTLCLNTVPNNPASTGGGWNVK